MHHYRRRLRRKTTAAVAAAAVLFTAAGCGSSSSAEPGAPATPAPTPSETEPSVEDQAEEEILTVYRELWRVQVEMYSVPTSHHDELFVYAHDLEVRDIRETAHWLATHNSKFAGEPVVSPEVTALDLDASTATITACVDNSEYVQVNSDGEPIDPDLVRLPNLVVSEVAVIDDLWKVTGSEVTEVESC